MPNYEPPESPIAGPSQADIDDIRRKADDFAREAFADVVKRFEPLRQRSDESETNAPADTDNTEG